MLMVVVIFTSFVLSLQKFKDVASLKNKSYSFEEQRIIIIIFSKFCYDSFYIKAFF